MLVAARDFRWKGGTGQGPVVLFARGLQRRWAELEKWTKNWMFPKIMVPPNISKSSILIGFKTMK